jgi:SNF2 family DNA or RNA helicase
MDNFHQLIKNAGFDPKDHQLEGVEWCLKNETEGHLLDAAVVKGGLLADDMGLGKTIQMLGVVVGNPLPRTLVVVPRALLDQWTEAIFAGLNHQPIVYHASQAHGVTPAMLASAPIVLTTYGKIAAKKKEKPQGNPLHRQPWDRVIFDEAHHLRNARTATHIGSMRLKSPIRWLVTGTPIQNSRSDFHSLCAAMGIPESYYRKPANLPAIARNFMLKRSKAQAGLRLPELNTSSITTSWQSPAELELAEDIHALLAFSGSNKEPNQVMQTMGVGGQLAALVRARQMCVYPPLLRLAVDRMIEDGVLEDTPALREALASTSKLDAVSSLILSRRHNGKSKLVFCHYRGEIDAIRRDLEAGGMRVHTFDGRVPAARRAAILTGRCDCLILQIKTGCEGLNLQQFSEVYFVSPHWNPAVEDQAVARCHRMGQDSAVEVFHFRARDDSRPEGKTFRTIDEYSADKQTEKREFMNELTADAEP